MDISRTREALVGAEQGWNESFDKLAESLKGGIADFMGYSLGGGVALKTAGRHPELVHKLVIVSAPCKQTGWYPEVLASMAQMGPTGGGYEAIPAVPTLSQRQLTKVVHQAR